MPVMRRRSPAGRHFKPKRQTWHHLRTTRGTKFGGGGGKSKHSYNDNSDDSEDGEDHRLHELMSYIASAQEDEEEGTTYTGVHTGYDTEDSGQQVRSSWDEVHVY